MICAACSTENRAGRRFCLNCGAPLGLACPNCGSENEPEARFCGSCGHALAGAADTGSAAATRPTTTAAAGAAAHGGQAQHAAERRLVSVLFADLVGFTPFAEERDAEEVRNTLERYSSLAREVVARYGGTIEKFIGDAVMAVWGTPVAHEDDAERAVRAALELVDSVPPLAPGIQARAGVLTGEAAVSLEATEQGFLAGDLVNTAARLQSVAPPGSVLVGESTMRAASAAVSFEAAGEQALKGKQAPLPAWRALRVIAQRGGAGRSETIETPFVGRDEEFRLVREQLHLTGRDPRVRVISITGAAGIGKSRLAWELEKYIDGVVEPVYWHRGRCPAYGEGVSFWALGEMVRSRARLSEGDDEPTTRARLKATVEEYVSDPAERDWIEQALLVLLGVEQQAQGGRESFFPAWRRFFESIATRGTTVLVFEDLHWADDGLLDFIDHLLEWSRSMPLYLVTLARPELFDRRPNWGAGRRTFTALALDPLPDAAMDEMLAALVPAFPETARRAIVERADGIPLYAVELVRSLLAEGRLVEVDGVLQPSGELGELHVPDSLRSLITSRLDALPAEDRRLLQDASVLGQSFTLPALASLADADHPQVEERLRQLVRRELLAIDADPRSPERGQYAFMQSLIREVAYSTLARPKRRARHLAAARHFESMGSDEMAGILARHYVAAHESSAAGAEADAVAVQARLALRAAAERAASLGGHAQAADFLGQAVRVTSADSDRAPLLERMGAELMLAGRYAEAGRRAREAVAAYGASQDAVGRARATVLVAESLIQESSPVPAAQELRAALEELGPDAAPEIRLRLLAGLARALYRNLEAEPSMAVADEALAIAEGRNLTLIVAELLVSKGTASMMLGRPYQAIALLKEGIEMARRHNDYSTALRGMANIGEALANHTSVVEAGKQIRDAKTIARQIGDRGYEIWLSSNAIWGSIAAGEPLAPVLADTVEQLEIEMAPSDRIRLTRHYLMLRHYLGLALEPDLVVLAADAADPQEEREVLLTEAMKRVADGDHLGAAELLAKGAHYRGDAADYAQAAMLAVLSGDEGKARQYLAQTDGKLGRGQWGDSHQLAARAALAAVEGDTTEAVVLFREALAKMRSIDVWFGYAVLGLLMLKVLGADHPEARKAGREALAIFERMGSPPLIQQAREALGSAEADAEPAAATDGGAAPPIAAPAITAPNSTASSR